MALRTTPVDINRGTSGLVLTPEQSNEIWAKAAESSAIMRLARRIELPGPGLSIPVITGDPVADWVAESTEKPVSNSTFDTKIMTPYKLAVIECFSNEFKRDFPALSNELVNRLPASLSTAFDQTVFTSTAPGTGFDVLSACTAISMTPVSPATPYDQLLSVLTTVAANGYVLDGWVIAPQGFGSFLSIVDGLGRPMLIDSVQNDGAMGRIFGAPVIASSHAYAAGTPNQIGVAGDWSKAVYGIVNGIQLSISEEATINDGTNQINLWQSNMFAVRCEAEISFAVADDDAFVLITE